MKRLWLVSLAALAVPVSAFGALPDRCPPAPHATATHAPSRKEVPARADAKPARHYWDDSETPQVSPPPPPPRHVWRDGYGKAYARPWASPPYPSPPDRAEGRPSSYRFDVWYGYDGRPGLESGL